MSLAADSALEARFHHLLRLADRLPRGASEDYVRRCVCALMGADWADQNAQALALMRSIAQLQHERRLGLRRVQQTGAVALDRLLTSLRADVLPMLPLPAGAERAECAGTKPGSRCTTKDPTMAFTERQIDGITILDLNGQLTELSGDEMWRRVRGLAAAGDKRVILNLADVSYVDSSGLGSMVASFVAMKRVGGMLKLLGPTKRTQQILTVTALLTVMPSFDNEAAAVASFVGAEPTPRALLS